MGRLQRYDVKPYGGNFQRDLEELYTKAVGMFGEERSVEVSISLKGQNRSLAVDVSAENFAEFLEILRLCAGPSKDNDEVL